MHNTKPTNPAMTMIAVVSVVPRPLDDDLSSERPPGVLLDTIKQRKLLTQFYVDLAE